MTDVTPLVEHLLSELADAGVQLPVPDWEYRAHPTFDDTGEEWYACGVIPDLNDAVVIAEQLQADEDNLARTDPLAPGHVTYRVERRRKAGPWELAPKEQS